MEPFVTLPLRIDGPSEAVDPTDPCYVLRNGLRSSVSAKEIDKGACDGLKMPVWMTP